MSSSTSLGLLPQKSQRKIWGTLLHGHWPVLGHMFAHSKCSQRYCTNCIVSHPSHNTGQVNIRYFPTHSHAKSMFPETNLRSRLKGYRYVSGNDVVDCWNRIKTFLAQQVCKRLSLTNVCFSIYRWAFRESFLPDGGAGHNAYQKPTKITVENQEPTTLKRSTGICCRLLGALSSEQSAST